MKKMTLMRTGYLNGVTREEQLTVLTPENVDKMANYVRSMLDNGNLIEERDYVTSTETGKRFLIMNGAQKIAIAFNLADYQETITIEEKPSGKVHGNSTKKAKGYWSYVVKSSLIHRFTNEMLDSCLGSCNSSEPEYESASSNTVLKIAGKRAYIGAVIKAAKCSNLFDIDINLSESKRKRIKSTSGTVDAPRYCAECKTNHIIKGMWLVESKNHNKFVAEICTKPNPKYQEYLKLSQKDILSMIISNEETLFGNIKIPDCKAQMIRHRKISVNNKVLSLYKIDSKVNTKENLVKYLLVLLDKIK